MTSSGIRFFKVILRSTLEDGNLKIPNNFISKFGVALPNPVFLRPPDGREWKVCWTKKDGEIWFQEGWKEFATYYSMDHGHLVVFEYEGSSSHFDVHIFGTGALEIDYPITQDQIIDDDEDSVEILNELPLRQNKRLKGVEKSPNPEDMHQCVQTEGSHSQGTNFEMPIDASVKQEWDGGNASEITSLMISTRNVRTRAVEEATKFTTKNPFFMINIRRYHLLKSKPRLPIDIIIKYFESKKRINAMIKLGKKKWPVKLLCYPLRNLAHISAGWLRFAKESKLCAGDICIFELINRKDSVFKVHVFRGQRRKGVEKSPNPQDLHQCVQSKGGNASEITSLMISTHNARTRAVEEAKKFTTKNPFFMINIRQYHLLRKNPKLPIDIIIKYFQSKKEINAMIKLGKKLWPVKLRYYDCPSGKLAQLAAGWALFARESKLCVGDTCIFELINRKDAVFNVHVFRGQRRKGVEKSPNSQDLHQCVQSKGENASEITSLLISTRNATTRALEEAKNFTTENPFVMINIRKIYQLKSALISSRYFIREYFENKMEINALMQLGKKLWPVKLLYYPFTKQGQFSAGWPRFAKENKLCVGDVCIFELINRKDAVFDVHVFRGQT